MSKYDHLPQGVLQSIRNYRNGKEKFTVMSLKVLYDNKYYYYVRYPKSYQFLVVEENGFIPSYHIAEEVTKITGRAIGINKALNYAKEKWTTKATTIKVYNQMIDIINYLDKDIVTQRLK